MTMCLFTEQQRKTTRSKPKQPNIANTPSSKQIAMPSSHERTGRGKSIQMDQKFHNKCRRTPHRVNTFISATDRHPSKTVHSDRTPCKGSTLGGSWSVFGQFRSKMTKTDQKPTENRLTTDPLQEPDKRLPLRRGEALWLNQKC